MNCTSRLLIVLAAALPALAMAQTPTVACDLVDQQAASKILVSNIKQHSPNRQVQAMDGAKVSSCVFFAERARLTSHLLEYPNADDAARAFKESTASSPHVSAKPESGLGDEATWWSIASEAHGMTVRKGKRVLIIDTRWLDGAQASDVGSRLRPSVRSMAGRL